MRKEGIRRVKESGHNIAVECVWSKYNPYPGLSLPHLRCETLGKFHKFIKICFSHLENRMIIFQILYSYIIFMQQDYFDIIKKEGLFNYTGNFFDLTSFSECLFMQQKVETIFITLEYLSCNVSQQNKRLTCLPKLSLLYNILDPLYC